MLAERKDYAEVNMAGVPWTPRDVWWGLLAFAVWMTAFVLSALLLRENRLAVNPGLIVSAGEALLVVPVWWFTVRKYHVPWTMLGLRRFSAGMIGLGCGLMLVSFAFNFVYGTILVFFNLRMQIDLVPIFAQLSSPWLLLVGGAVIAPVVEELFFRGFVFAGLRQKYGWQKSAFISAALFALLHLTPTAIIPIFVLGYIFAYLYYRSDSIWPAILMHVLTNTLALGAAYLVANAPAWGLPLGA